MVMRTARSERAGKNGKGKSLNRVGEDSCGTDAFSLEGQERKKRYWCRQGKLNSLMLTRTEKERKIRTR